MTMERGLNILMFAVVFTFVVGVALGTI